MRYSAEHKAQTRQAILAAAGRVFRADGYGGAGIDGLTKAAGVTNGAFYGHFKSKAEAFRDIVGIGLRELRDGIAAIREQHGAAWLPAFVDFYLGFKRTCDITEACALPTLSGEVVRADAASRAVYEAEFREVIDVIAAGLGTDAGATDRAISILAMLSGAVTFARAVPDADLSARIAASVRASVLALAATAPKRAVRRPATASFVR